MLKSNYYGISLKRKDLNHYFLPRMLFRLNFTHVMFKDIAINSRNVK